MQYVIFFTILIFLIGISSWISSMSEIPPDVKKNLSPNDIELINNELQQRRWWGLLLILISMFFVMIYLSVFFNRY